MEHAREKNPAILTCYWLTKPTGSGRQETPGLLQKADRATRPQVEEHIDAGRIVVFFLDDNQSVRPDEVGTTEMIVNTVRKLNIPVKTYVTCERSSDVGVVPSTSTG